jgi:outer membrane protein OmpA-like peptidoglycan-associated protein
MMIIRLLLFLIFAISSPFLSLVEAQKENPAIIFHENLKYEEIKEGQLFELVHIHFKRASDTLFKSYPELNHLAWLLKKYPSIKIRLEIYSGPDKDTIDMIKLSERRVNTIKAYLVEKGIAEHRIEGVGKMAKYSRSCENRLLWDFRRVEIRIISK